MNSKHIYRRLVRYKHEGPGTILSVESGKVFHVVEGRNAWHSTWVVQYQPNSFYSSLASAKDYAESIRKSGSVFTIFEQPSLIIRSENKTTIVTEINHENPLVGHLIGQDIGEIAKAAMSDYRERSKFLPDFIKGFMSTSFGWRRKVSDKNLIMLQHCNPELKIKGVSNPLKARTSRSHGSGYFLSWYEKNILVSSKAVLRITENLECLLDKDAMVGVDFRYAGVGVDKELHILKAKTFEYIRKKTRMEEDVCQVLSENFLDELKEAYTDRAIVSADDKDVLLLVSDWLKSLGQFSPEDRKKILSREAIKNNGMPFFKYR